MNAGAVLLAVGLCWLVVVAPGLACARIFQLDRLGGPAAFRALMPTGSVVGVAFLPLIDSSAIRASASMSLSPSTSLWPLMRLLPSSTMTLFVLGWCTTLCGLISLRAYPWMPIGADQRFLAAHPQTERGLRLAYEWADQHLDPQVVLQHDPTRPRAVAFALYGRHRVAVADSYGSLFGADPKAVAARIRALAPIFREGLAPADLRLRMVVNGIDALVMTKDDPVWTITNAPIWRVTPLYASDSVRIVARSSLEESTAPPLSATVAASMPSSKDN